MNLLVVVKYIDYYKFLIFNDSVNFLGFCGVVDIMLVLREWKDIILFFFYKVFCVVINFNFFYLE